MIGRFEGQILDASEQNVISHVESYGWSVAHIEPSSNSVGWSFTIGLYENYAHPEVIIFGLSEKTRHDVLNWIGKNVKSGKKFSTGIEHDWVLDDCNCTGRPVEKKWYPDLLGWAIWFYGNQEFPCVQCLWPGRDGAYPWNSNQIAGAQPLLYESDLLSARMLHFASDQSLTKEEWPFANALHERVFVSRCVVEDNEPIVKVVRDQDGEWQFIGPVEDPDADGCKISCFHCVVERDPSLRKLAKLQTGWRASRQTQSDEWIISKDS